MYLTNLFIENMGSIEKLQILEKDLFLENGNPKPIILLGKNGSGKTTMISSIGDSFLELANKRFNHILLPEGIGYKYYKASGKINTRLGKTYSYAYLQFKNNENLYEYIDKNGNLKYDECREKTNNFLNLNLGDWEDDKNYKRVTDVSKDDAFFGDFQNNTYCYFPADRFEFPHRLIRESDKYTSNFNDEKKYYGDLGKSIIIKNSLDEIKSWILDLFLDARTGLIPVANGYVTTQNTETTEYLQQGIKNIENILSSILGKGVRIDTNLRGQGNSRIRVIDEKTNQDIVPSLDNLSAGESILLGMFGTIIKNSDLADLNKSVRLEDIEGIVAIDEIDLHLHIRLQKEVLPKLIKLFPKVQFIISTHSPFFLYGINEEFGDNILMLNMPSGIQITNVNDFEEFNNAYKTFEGLTENYEEKYKKLKKEIEEIKKPLIICEGKTDVIHINKAIEKLGITDLNDIKFFDIPNEGRGDQQTRELLENVCKLKNTHKIIGIFDRDNDKICKVIGNDIKKFGDKVYGFCIPVPKGREKYNKISIEFYYDDKDLKHKYNGECLYFDNEVLYDPKKKQGVLIKNPKDIEDKQIFDKDIGNTKGICSKGRFAELVATNKNFTKDFNFENFRLIIDKIKEILEKDD